MAEEKILLCEASRDARLGSGHVALTISGAEKKSLERRLGTAGLVAESNGILKGRAVRALWEISRRERAGSEKMCGGRAVRALWERSRLTKEVRSAKLSGSDARRFI
jgi:hypothetical protein